MRSSRKPALNPDLWEVLLALADRHEMHYHWVKGHADNEWNNRYGDEKVWLEFARIPEKEIYAARYEKVADNGAVWDTDYVADFTERTISIRLERSFLEDALTFQENFSTPYYIKTLIRDGYLEPDGDIPVEYVPRSVAESDRDCERYQQQRRSHHLQVF